MGTWPWSRAVHWAGSSLFILTKVTPFGSGSMKTIIWLGPRGRLILRAAKLSKAFRKINLYSIEVFFSSEFCRGKGIWLQQRQSLRNRKAATKIHNQKAASSLSLWFQEAFPETPGRKNVCFNRKLDTVYSVPFLRDLKAEPMGNIRQLWHVWVTKAALTCRGILPGGWVTLLLVEKPICLSLHLYFNIPLLWKFFLYLIPYHL